VKKALATKETCRPDTILHGKQRKFEPLEHSVYLGRERLGRYVRTDRKKYKAFDANDRPLGNFRVRHRALAAIRKARSERL
jgi:hypothetical protein